MQAATPDLDPAATPDLGPLAWVLDELRKSLESASSALRRFVRDAAAARGQDMASVDAGQLRIARQHMHQAVGALEMVGLPAPAHMLRSMEAAVQKFVERPGLCTEPAAAKVERAGFALTEYLEALLLGRNVQALSLFAQYRDVQELRGAERVHPADLWPIDWRWNEPDDVPAGPPLAYQPAVRARMDQSVLQIVKSADAAAGRELAVLSLRLAAGQPARQPRTFWKIAAGYFEAVGAGLLPPDVYVKRAASRVLLQYASLAKGEQDLSERLAQDLVFFCAQVPPQRAAKLAALAAVRAAYGLADSAPVDYAASPFGRFDPAVLALARKRIAAAKETWSALSGGDVHKLKPVGEQVGLVCEALLKLYPATEALARSLGAAVDAVVRTGRAPATGIAMEVATAILYLEAAFLDLDPDQAQVGERAARLAQRLDRVLQGGEPEALEQWVEDLYRRVGDRQTMGSVVGELRGTLGELEKVLDQFFRQPGETAPLRDVPAHLAQMRGVLSVLGLDQAALAVQRMRETIEGILVDGAGPARADGTFDRLGNSLGALGFLIDMLSYQPALAKKLFVYDEALGELRPMMGRAPAAEPAQPRQESEPDMAPVTGSDAGPPEAPRADALEPLLVSAPVLVELAPPEAVEPAPVAVAAAPAPEPDSDEELREIFLEEAREVAASGLAALRALAAEPANVSELTTLRRAFHTLKGSSRMVGLTEFGEAAWAMEQLLNTWLADQKPAVGALRAFAQAAMEGFQRWIADIAAGSDATWSAAPFRASADALRLENRNVPLALARVEAAVAGEVPPALEAEVSSGALPASEAGAAGGALPAVEETVAGEPLAAPEAAAAAGAWPEADEVLPEEASPAADDPAYGQEAPALDGFVAGAAPDAIGGDAADDGSLASEAFAGFDAFPGAPAFDAAADTGMDPVRAGEPDFPPLSAQTVATAADQPADALPLVFDFDLELPGADPMPAAPRDETTAQAPFALDDTDETLSPPPPAVAAPSFDFDLDLDFLDVPAAPADAQPATVPAAVELDVADLPPEFSDLADLPPEFSDLAASLAADRAPVAPDAWLASFDFGSASNAAPTAQEQEAQEREAHEQQAREREALQEQQALPQVAAVQPQEAAQPELTEDEEAAQEREAARIAAADSVAARDEQIKVIGELRIGIPLYNVYLNEADEWSRRLATEISEWAIEFSEPVADSTLGWAHALAGASATVGFHALSDIARALEGALQRVQAAASGTPQHAAAFTLAAEEIRWLLHQFAAGFLKQPDPAIMEALESLKESEAAPVPQERVEAVEAAAPVFAVPAAPASALPRDEDGSDFDVADAVDPDLFAIFEEEAAELMPQVGSLLRQWHAHPHQREPREGVLRALHTLKGSARLAGALRLGELAHRLESEVEYLAGDAINPADLEALLHRYDQMQARFETLRATGGQPAAAAAEPGVPPAPEPVVAPREELARPVATALAATRQAAHQSVRVRAQLLDRLMNQAGEVMITRSRLEAELKQLRGALGDLTGNLDRLRRQLRDVELQAETQMQSRLALSRDSAANFDPLEFDRFTRVQELTRMMAESVNDVATVQRNIQRTVEATEDDLIAQARQTRELQRDLLRTRMVEFEGIADRLYRVVRLAAKETGKQVMLDIEGGSIEMDRGVLDRMTPAFEHLLRNCVAHGIEAPGARTAAGKAATGRITVHVRQEGNDVSVEFTDDGAGLDLPRIRAKAMQQGLVPADQVLGEADIANLVFLPGLSTAGEVTELAGRGIGMDVVRSDVNAVGGRIETRTAAGRGTSFKLVLPLTTAVTQVVMIRCGPLALGVPANLVDIVRRVHVAEVEQAHASGHYAYDGEALPFFWGGALLHDSARSAEPQGKTTPVVIFRSAAQRVAVHVDEVLGNHEVVVKNLGPQLSRLPGLAGMTVLPSGAVVLIYNPVALSQVYGEPARRLALESPAPRALQAAGGDEAGPGAADQAPLVLVVDDSITVRRVTQRLLQREGYRVALAADGLQALERLAEERPAVVLSDIEMPRMDGFDLVRNVRADARLADLPVVMVTSRIAQKHREHARELGVDHYLGKPYSEEELLGLVRAYSRPAVSV